MDFTERYWSQRARIYKDNTSYPESPEWSTLMSATAPNPYDFSLAKDFIDWIARQFLSHLRTSAAPDKNIMTSITVVAKITFPCISYFSSFCIGLSEKNTKTKKTNIFLIESRHLSFQNSV